MEVKRKPISRSDWKRVLKKKIAYCETKEKPGMACLIQAKEITAPLIKSCFGRELMLLDVDYYWLQLAFKDEKCWLTVMFDEKGNFVQYYVDVTRKNVIDGENSYFEDVFLDVIIGNNDEVEILDAEELKMALDEKVISQDEYDFANKKVEQIIDYILNNRDRCDTIAFYYFDILKKLL